MSLDSCAVDGVPGLTARVARAAFPKGTLAIRVREVLGPIFDDDRFRSAFSTTGRPAITPGRLALVCVLQCIEGLSDRAAAEAVRARMDWKYLLGLALEDPGFHFSALSQFRDRLCRHGLEEAVLEAVVDRCSAAGLIAPGGEVRVDSTRIDSIARGLNRMEFVAETLRLALEAVAVAAPEWLAERIDADQQQRYGRPIDQWRLPTKNADVGRWVARVGAEGYALLAAIDTAAEEDARLDWLPRIPAVAVLRRVWSQQYRHDETGTAVWRKGKELPPGSEIVETPHDPEARRGFKRKTAWKGWKLHLAETCGDAERPDLICHVDTTAAVTSDIARISAILRRLPSPLTVYADTGYMSIYKVFDAASVGIDLIGPMRSANQAGDQFGHEAFGVDWEARTALCPGGHRPHAWAPGVDRAGQPVHRIKWLAATCAACPLRPSCTKATGRSKWGRQLSILPRREYEALAERRAREATVEWQARYHRRAGVEGTISQALHHTRIRRSRYKGRTRTHLRHCLAAAAINLIRIDAWASGHRPATTRSTHLARLEGKCPQPALTDSIS